MVDFTLGDLSRNFVLRRQNTFLKQNLERLTQELSSGQAADVSDHLSARLAPLADLEHESRILNSQKYVVAELQSQTGAMQKSLENIQDKTASLAEDLAVASVSISAVNVAALAGEAKASLGSIVSSLNTSIAGRALFSGTTVDVSPVADPDTLLTGLAAAVSGALSAADVLSAADTYFETLGGGFETDVYLGATENLSPISLGSGDFVALDTRADDPVFRANLKAVALSAMLDDLSGSLSPSEQQKLTKDLAELALSNQSQITGLRATLGYAEQRIEAAVTRTAVETQAVELGRDALLGVDPFQTATDLEAVQNQLETLYTITSRSFRLSLVNFLS
ncbi:flagellin [Roseovarius phycicola]|uniref:Flagellin n=1 Tax=Roseovarius phycicola TaxID=3080976 RepID=A0ABZ2HMD4_9RHOB